MKYNETNTMRNARARSVLLLACLSLVASAQHVAAQQFYDSFSKMLSVTSTLQSNFYNDIIRANSGSFGQVSRAPQVTQQEIANLCKPFVCSGPKPSIMGGQPAYSQPPATVTPAYVPPPAPRQYPIAATDFRPVGGRILPDEISRNAQGTPEEKEMLRMLSNQSLDTLEKEGRKNNVANAFGLLTSVSMQIVLGRELTDAEEQQLISGFNTALVSSPQFASMPARDRQLLYESAAVAGGMMAFLHVQGKEQNDAKIQSDARTMAKAVLISLFGIKIE